MKSTASNHHFTPGKEANNASCGGLDAEPIASFSIQNLLELVAQKEQAIEQKEQIIEKKSHVIEQLNRRIQHLEDYLRLERHRRFGPSSEKHPNQGELLFNEAEEVAAEEPAETALDALQEATATPKKRGRKGLSKSLPRHQVHIPLSDEEKAGAINTFYTVIKEELDIVPAKARVIEYLQEKAIFLDHGQRQIKVAEPPRHPLNKCIASVHLLAFVIVSKYCDGLPLYGLEAILKRHGGEITRTSMANMGYPVGV